MTRRLAGIDRTTAHGRRPGNDTVTIYSVVAFGSADRIRVEEVVVAFESAPAADRFAVDTGLVDYAVAPLRFRDPAGRPQHGAGSAR